MAKTGNDTTIRPYTPDDMVAAVGLWYRAWHESHPGQRHAFPIEEWRERWMRWVVPAAAIHVATLNGSVAGYVAVVPAAPWQSHVIVTPEYRRRGIGRQLVDAAKVAGAGELVFDVFEVDADARSFYAGCGFEPGETVAHPRTGESMVRYRWTANASPGVRV
jgi:GNAT superfamily N-acetyltransferase